MLTESFISVVVVTVYSFASAYIEPCSLFWMLIRSQKHFTQNLLGNHEFFIIVYFFFIITKGEGFRTFSIEKFGQAWPQRVT